MADHPAMRWWGWGDPERPPALPEHAAPFLRERFGVDGGVVRRPVALEDVRLRAPALAARARDRLVAVLGAERLRDDRTARVRHAAGKSYPDLLRQRAGDCEAAPDAVALPASHEQVRELLAVCTQERVAVVPFGGGTSVVGGVEPLRGTCAALIALDLGDLDGLLALDAVSRTATLGAGTRGPEADAALAAHGLTLGHVPQSYEYASIGGYVATRSAGQASTGYGRIDALVRGLRFAAPAGELALPAFPASAAGPALRELVVGSEGTLGVITAATLRVRPAPAVQRYEGWFFHDFAEGAAALRAVAQARAAPDVARLSDAPETELNLALAGDGLARRLGDLVLRVRGYRGGCLAIFGWEGAEQDVDERRARSAELLRAGGGMSLGTAPGRSWAHGRFGGPYLRDDLLDRGVLVETLETATAWSNLERLHAAVAAALTDALAARGTAPLVGCHVSHLYETGASLYFTFLGAQEPGAELEQWQAAKAAACDAIVAHGGTITHHHAVGRDHAPWLEHEVGATGVALLRAAKAELDPAGIMNPGKLLPGAAA